MWHDYAEEARPEREGRVAGVLGALRAVGLLRADEAEAWRPRLSGLGVERPTASERTRRAADRLLQELLEAVPVEAGGRGDDARRFWGAMAALHTVGASSGGWYERLARGMGWPTARKTGRENSGGTQKDLRAVLAGPAEAVDGVRVLCVLRFTDGVSLLLRLEDGADQFGRRARDFELVDDVGTTYSRGGGGGTRVRRILYRTPAPADARWLELRREGRGRSGLRSDARRGFGTSGVAVAPGEHPRPAAARLPRRHAVGLPTHRPALRQRS